MEWDEPLPSKFIDKQDKSSHSLHRGNNLGAISTKGSPRNYMVFVMRPPMPILPSYISELLMLNNHPLVL